MINEFYIYCKAYYSVDTAKKAEVFSTDDVYKFLSSSQLSDPYWLVRKVVVLLAYFGGKWNLDCHLFRYLPYLNIFVFLYEFL